LDAGRRGGKIGAVTGAGGVRKKRKERKLHRASLSGRKDHLDEKRASGFTPIRGKKKKRRKKDFCMLSSPRKRGADTVGRDAAAVSVVPGRVQRGGGPGLLQPDGRVEEKKIKPSQEGRHETTD